MFKKHSVIWWILLACALICSAVLLVGRFSSEQQSRQACAAIQLDDLILLADESGISAEQWQDRLAKAGVCYFVPTLDEDSFGALPMIENRSRMSLVLPEGTDILTYDGKAVKTLYLYYKYGVRVIDSDPQEIEDLMFRAVIERGQRLIVLTPFFDENGERVSDIEVYEDCMNGLSERLEARGIDYGEGFSCVADAASGTLLLLGAGFAPALLGAWLLCCILRRKSWETPVSVAACAAVAALTVWNAALAQTLTMFASAVLLPCVFAVLMLRYLKAESAGEIKRPVAVNAAAAVCVTAACGIIGGLSVAALMTSRAYLYGYVMFRGVKLALLAPLAFAGLLLLIELIQEKLPRAKFIRTGVICAVLLCIAGAVMLLRSGDVSSHAPGMDKVIAVRNWFEYNFFVRPRTKEMLVAVPCIPVFVWSCRHRLHAIRLLTGMGVCLECVSVVNTFCHATAPLTVSLIRTLLGVGIGAVVGFAALGVLELIRRCLQKPAHDGA